MQNKDNTGFWVVMTVALIGGIGYWYYKNNLESTVNSVKKTTKFLGIF
jgi:hypothetical protein